MSAGTVVIGGGILAAVILLTIVGFLCLCRLQYYCCKEEESEKGEEQEADPAAASPSRPLALCAPPAPSTPEHHSAEPETYPPTFLTEANGPSGSSPSPPPRWCHRPHAACPSCARCTLPVCTLHAGGRVGCRKIRGGLDLPAHLDGFYHKLDLIRSCTLNEVLTHSVSTDV